MNKLKALKVNDWLVVAGGALVLIFGLFRWFTWEVSVDERGRGPETDEQRLRLPSHRSRSVALIIGAGGGHLLLATERAAPGNVPVAARSARGDAARVRADPHPPDHQHDLDVAGEGADADVSRGIGIWMSALGALVAFVGAFIGFRNTGLEAEYTPVSGRPTPDREIPPPGDVAAP